MACLSAPGWLLGPCDKSPKGCPASSKNQGSWLKACRPRTSMPSGRRGTGAPQRPTRAARGTGKEVNVGSCGSHGCFRREPVCSLCDTWGVGEPHWHRGSGPLGLHVLAWMSTRAAVAPGLARRLCLTPIMLQEGQCRATSPAVLSRRLPGPARARLRRESKPSSCVRTGAAGPGAG